MKTQLLKFSILYLIITIISVSCEIEDDDEDNSSNININSTSIIPPSTSGRPNTYLGCIEIDSRITSIEVWDHGQIDGDIVSIMANGNTIIDQQVLDGPSNPIRRNYDFGFNGFNYITLFAHNLGDIAPNTCTISINGVEFILEANLDANGSIDVIVDGFGVDCSDAGGGNSNSNQSNGSGGNGNNSNGNNGGNGNSGDGTGDVKFWLNQDFGCGNVTVSVSGVGTSVINSFFGSAPLCSNNSGGGNFNNLPSGTYQFTGSCDGRNWNGSFTIQEGVCLQFLLN